MQNSGEISLKVYELHILLNRNDDSCICPSYQLLKGLAKGNQSTLLDSHSGVILRWLYCFTITGCKGQFQNQYHWLTSGSVWFQAEAGGRGQGGEALTLDGGTGMCRHAD